MPEGDGRCMEAEREVLFAEASSVQQVAFYGTSQAVLMGGMNPQLVSPAGEGAEKYFSLAGR